MEEKFIPKDIGDYKAETASGRESLDNSFNLEILPFLKEGNINAFADLGDVKEKIRRLVEKPFIDKLTGKAIYEAKKYIMRKDNKGELHTSFSFKKKYLINNVIIGGESKHVRITLGIPEDRDNQPEVTEVEVLNDEE